MSTVVHRTPGLIPIESFTTMGLSSKPNTRSPIGRFGTGLKYAIAVLLRHKQNVTIFIGSVEYVFFTAKAEFRGKDFDFVRMKKRIGVLSRWQYDKLPFTTELGKDWELWQAYRELHSNTLDEMGATFIRPSMDKNGQNKCTLIAVEGNAYSDCYHDRNRVFLPDGIKERKGSERLQLLDKPSKHIYFRGLRVMDLQQEAQYTYNILAEVELTEDRTVKYPFIVEAIISGFMQESEDKVFMDKAVKKPILGSYEANLNHSHSSYWGGGTKPTAIYLGAARRSENPTARKVWEGLQPTIRTHTGMRVVIPCPTLDDQEIADISIYLSNIWPEAVLIEDSGRQWAAGQATTDVYGDDIPF